MERQHTIKGHLTQEIFELHYEATINLLKSIHLRLRVNITNRNSRSLREVLLQPINIHHTAF